MPSFERRHEWIYWLSGYGRGQISSLGRGKKRRKFSPSRPVDDQVEEESGSGSDRADDAQDQTDEMDEEEWMNDPLSRPLVEEEKWELEEEGERHKSREPTLTILSHLSTVSRSLTSDLNNPNPDPQVQIPMPMTLSSTLSRRYS